MPANLPFQPGQASATVGNTVKVTANSGPTSVPGTVTCKNANSIQVSNLGTIAVFVRMSSEAIPVATAADLPIKAGDTRVLANPVATGTLGVACLASAGTACDVYFTPGTGGS